MNYFSDNYTYKYINGNYLVTSKYGGSIYKEALRVNEKLVSDFPDSIDLKLSNRCSNGCPFCHENSTPKGKLFNLDRTKEILSQLPELPIEIAIGGGNILETPEEIRPLIEWLIGRGNLVRCTIRLKDLFKLTTEQRDLLSLFPAIGISLDEEDFLKVIEKGEQENSYKLFSRILDDAIFEIINPTIEDMSSKYRKIRTYNVWAPKIVYHIIAGMFSVESLKKLFLYEITENPILILGFKQFGRAEHTPLPESISETEKYLKRLIYDKRMRGLKSFTGTLKDGIRSFDAGNKLVFDNLALEQLHIKDALLQGEWESLFMGEEGEHSMYIDAVEGTYARNSRSSQRTDWNEIDLLDYFRSL